MTGLSKKQRAALDAIAAQPRDPAALALLLDTSKEGAAATASSLVRRGLVRRERRAGRVSYWMAHR